MLKVQWDAYQKITLSTIAFGLVVEIYFFFTEGIHKEFFVSEGLEAVLWYRVALTAFVVVLLCECVIFFWWQRRQHPIVSTIGSGIAGGAVKSWLILLVMSNSDFPTIHLIATLAFLTNVTLYAGLLLWLEYSNENRNSVYFYLLFSLSFILACVYIGLWISVSPSAWAMEHVTWIVFSLTLACFFASRHFIESNSYTQCNIPAQMELT